MKEETWGVITAAWRQSVSQSGCSTSWLAADCRAAPVDYDRLVIFVHKAASVRTLSEVYLLATLLGTCYQQGASFIQSYNHVPLVFIKQLLFYSIATVFFYFIFLFFYLIAAINFYLTAVNMRQWKRFLNHEVLHTFLCVCAIMKLCLLWFILLLHVAANICQPLFAFSCFSTWCWLKKTNTLSLSWCPWFESAR